MATSNRINRLLFGDAFLNHLKDTNILLIGVGGIGCEVLKVLTQFEIGSLHILDLDTIEVSNLNRQFLFRKHHRGHYKAHVAREVLTAEFPHLKIYSYNQNIRDPEFGQKFFRKFQLVIMALDNQETRSFVNKQCMIADIPVIDAGTTGFKGQSFILKRGETRCYDCFPRSENKKSYPACTIRTLPEKPEHCIIWAKYVYTVLFSGQLEDDDDSNLLSDITQHVQGENYSDYEKGCYLFKQIFEIDVQKQKEGEDNVKFQHLVVLNKDELQKKLVGQEDYLNKKDLVFYQSEHSPEIYMDIFTRSFEKLIQEKREKGCVPFEKDDDLCMKFITSACNLRCIVFSLHKQTQFQVKEIAGSIVPAIASTNSIVSAIELTETMKLLQRQFFRNDKYKNRELYIQNDMKTKIIDVKPGTFNPMCLSCNVNLLPQIAECDFNTTKLGDFISQVLPRSEPDEDVEETLGKLENYSISFGSLILYEQEEGMEEDELELNEKKRNQSLFSFFKELGDCKLTVTDEDNNQIYSTFLFCHVPNENPDKPAQFIRVHTQKKDLNNPITWTTLLIKQNEENQKKLEATTQKQSGKSNDQGQLEIDDSDSEDIVLCNEEGEKKQEQPVAIENMQIEELNRKRTSIESQGEVIIADEEEDDIIFEEPTIIKKNKAD